MTVLIVEQRARAVLAISDRTYVLGGGEVRMEGTPDELSASPEFGALKLAIWRILEAEVMRARAEREE